MQAFEVWKYFLPLGIGIAFMFTKLYLLGVFILFGSLLLMFMGFEFGLRGGSDDFED